MIEKLVKRRRASITRFLFPRSDKIGGKIPDHVGKIVSKVTSELPSSKLPLGLADVLAARMELVS
jgi:hypothetical protein